MVIDFTSIFVFTIPMKLSMQEAEERGIQNSITLYFQDMPTEETVAQMLDQINEESFGILQMKTEDLFYVNLSQWSVGAIPMIRGWIQ